MEFWRDVINWEGFYQVSNKGRVRSLDRTYQVTDKRWKTTYSVSIKGRILKGSLNTQTGYIHCVFTKGKGFPNVTVLNHRLVATAFHPNPNNLPFVHHIDHDKTNNAADNLRWVTPKENAEEFQKHPEAKFRRKNRIEKQKREKFTDDQIRWMRKLREEGYRFSDLAEIFRADRWYISKYLNDLPKEAQTNIYCKPKRVDLVCPQ